jgi:hypothetical protein
MDREARRANFVLAPATVRLENGNEVFGAREHVDVGLAGVVVLRQCLARISHVGLAHWVG